MRPPDLESALLYSEGLRLSMRQGCETLFYGILTQVKSARHGGCGRLCPATRLRELVMRIGNGSFSRAAADPTLISRLEAHACESGDVELQQLIKKYLAEP